MYQVGPKSIELFAQAKLLAERKLLVRACYLCKIPVGRQPAIKVFWLEQYGVGVCLVDRLQVVKQSFHVATGRCAKLSAINNDMHVHSIAEQGRAGYHYGELDGILGIT